MVGIGADLISLAPRIKSEVGDKTYKVKERVTSVSVEAHARYTDDNWKISAKTIMGENLAHLCMLGGYGVSSIDKRTGRTGVYVLPSFNDLVERGVWQEMATRIVCRVFEKPGGRQGYYWTDLWKWDSMWIRSLPLICNCRMCCLTGN